MHALSHTGSAAAHFDAPLESLPPPLPSRTANQTIHRIQENQLTASAILRHLRCSDPGSGAVPAEVKVQYEALCEAILENRHLRNDCPSGAQSPWLPETSFVQVPIQQRQVDQVSDDAKSLERMSKDLLSRSREQLMTTLAPLAKSVAALQKSAKGLPTLPDVLQHANGFLFDCESRFRASSSQRFGIAAEIRNAQRIKAGVDECLQAFQQLKQLEGKAKLAYRQGHGEAYVTAFVNAQGAAAKSDMAAFALHLGELKSLLQ